jgi:hypothetical protein
MYYPAVYDVLCTSTTRFMLPKCGDILSFVYPPNLRFLSTASIKEQLEKFQFLSLYLVDPASSHMLVSKIKPCKSTYKHLYCETAESSLYQL